MFVIELCISSRILYNFVIFSGSWQFCLLFLQLTKVESLKFEASFMSERATLFLSSIGLLGEYCPKSRKKNRHTADKVGCMHLGLSEGYNTHCLGSQFFRPFPIVNFTGKGESRNTAAADLCIF